MSWESSLVVKYMSSLFWWMEQWTWSRLHWVTVTCETSLTSDRHPSRSAVQTSGHCVDGCSHQVQLRVPNTVADTDADNTGAVHLLHRRHRAAVTVRCWQVGKATGLPDAKPTVNSRRCPIVEPVDVIRATFHAACIRCCVSLSCFSCHCFPPFLSLGVAIIAWTLIAYCCCYGTFDVLAVHLPFINCLILL